MAFTLQHIDRKISEAQKVLDFWQDLRELAVNPLFREIEEMRVEPDNGAASPLPVRRIPFPIEDVGPPPPSEYGAVQRLTLEYLPATEPGLSPQEIAQKIADSGYKFKTKYPAISVNGALGTLRDKGKARTVGKSRSNATLWIRINESVGAGSNTDRESAEYE